MKHSGLKYYDSKFIIFVLICVQSTRWFSTRSFRLSRHCFETAVESRRGKQFLITGDINCYLLDESLSQTQRAIKFIEINTA